jgi:hypothetical protein
MDYTLCVISKKTCFTQGHSYLTICILLEVLQKQNDFVNVFKDEMKLIFSVISFWDENNGDLG